jgi:hypothetical protein
MAAAGGSFGPQGLVGAGIGGGQGFPSAMAADGKIDTKTAMMRAKVIALQIASGGKVDPNAEAKDVVVSHFSDELEINDYPHQVRHDMVSRNLKVLFAFCIILFFS